MNIQQIEENIKGVAENIIEENFIYDFLLSFGLPRASINRLEKGDLNSSKIQGEVLWKRKIFFKVEKENNLLETIDEIKKENRILKHKPLFIVVTDFKTILAIDTKTGDTLDLPIKRIYKRFEFFLPLIGLEKTKLQVENPADLKAAENLGKLYDVLVEKNRPKTDEEKHALNVFLSRLLFCFFAEDTSIFPEGMFTNSIASHTSEDGSDLADYLKKLFSVLNEKKRNKVSGYLSDFPFVNGGLFKDALEVPQFNSKARKIILECGSLNWANINPDIFGSMIQAVANPAIRSDMGMHYTSVVNIMKVLRPLFLNDLYKELEEAGSNRNKLQKLRNRLYKIRIFDPACGSGNFLIIAYKELCALEIKIYQALNKNQMTMRLESGIKTNQFYGIEISDFACETAKLSLWLAEHQMNMQFEEIFGKCKPTLPLEDGGNIHCGNATRVTWDKVCRPNKDEEIYILGNPPYLGATVQTKEQKQDVVIACDDFKGSKLLDYIGAWFYKASKFIEKYPNTKSAFVSTNSVSQGSLVPILWPEVLKNNAVIFFAHSTFVWKNNARNNAGVECVVIGLESTQMKSKKYLYKDNHVVECKNISPYLIDGETEYVFPSKKPLNGLPEMGRGSAEHGNGNLILDESDRNNFIQKDRRSEKFILQYMGAEDFIRGSKRYCIWIEDDMVEEALEIPLIADRVEKVRVYRTKSKARDSNKTKGTPYKFTYPRHNHQNYIFIPRLTSRHRRYIPIGFLDKRIVASDGVIVVLNADITTFAIINSYMHQLWLKFTGGRFKSDYRYSSELSYNTFPAPNFSSKQIDDISEKAFEILDCRERHSDKTLGELYHDSQMPKDLRAAHSNLDYLIESCYRTKPFVTDEERIKYLFKLYREMIK